MAKKRIRQAHEDRIFSAIIYSIAALLLIIVLYPLIYVVSASLSDPMELIMGHVVLLPKSFTLQAYQEVLRSNDVLTGIKNTLLYTFVGTTVNIILTTMAAYPLSRRDMMGHNALTLLFTFTIIFTGGMIPTFLTIKDLQLLDTFWVMVLPTAINVTNMLIMRNYFLHSVPGEIIEAATVDGCSNVGMLVRIVIPISRTIIGVLLIYYFVEHWNSYKDALLYLNDRNMYPLQVFLRQILMQNTLSDMASGSSNESAATVALLYETLKYAVIVVASLPALIIYPFMQRFFTQGIMIGAIKG